MAKRSKPLIVLYPSMQPDPQVVAALKARGCTLYEAYTTEGAIRGLTRHTDLVICAGADKVIPTPEASTEALAAVLARLEVPVVTPDEFLANPEETYGEALLCQGDRIGLQHLAPRLVLVTGYAGGVGKTTTSLATARLYATSLHPVAVVEAGLGTSGLGPRLGLPDAPSLYDVVTGQARPAVWQGVSILPADEAATDVIAQDARLAENIDRLQREYKLIIVDASPKNKLWPALLDRATDVVIVATPREETVIQAQALQRELTKMKTGHIRKHLVMTQVKSIGQRIGLGETAVPVPFDPGKAERYDPALARELLARIYPGWIGAQRVRRSRAPFWAAWSGNRKARKEGKHA